MSEVNRDLERWLPVVEYEGWYEVSDLGRVRSVDRVTTNYRGTRIPIKGRTKTLSPGFGGYMTTSLYRNGQHVKRRVHSLVLDAFVGLAPAGMECLHKNGDPVDNRLSNLRWGTSSDNKWDIVQHGNHWATLKSVCPLNHELRPPNLVNSALRIGRRSCLTCNRAKSNERYARLQGYAFDLQAVSAEHYARIMGNA
jgi:hypothetical protein